MHCQRLADTAQDVLQRKLEETPEMEGRFRQALAFLEPAAIQAVFKRECLTALDYLHGVEDGPCEYQVTVLLTCDTLCRFSKATGDKGAPNSQNSGTRVAADVPQPKPLALSKLGGLTAVPTRLGPPKKDAAAAATVPAATP
eukprot:g10167.t1